MSITVLAEIKFKATAVDKGLKIFKSVIEPSCQEEGCEYYQLYHSPEDLDAYIMVERWADKESWEKHLGSEHNQHASSAIQPHIENINVRWFQEVKSVHE